jgi:serine/threonine protein kinase
MARWACGVLLYEMLVGETPFYDDDIMNTYHRIIAGDVKFPEFVSATAKDLIMKFLHVRF